VPRGIGLTVAKREIGWGRVSPGHRADIVAIHVDGVEVVEPWAAGACDQDQWLAFNPSHTLTDAF
jgi:hypothetical protein